MVRVSSATTSGAGGGRRCGWAAAWLMLHELTRPDEALAVEARGVVAQQLLLTSREDWWETQPSRRAHVGRGGDNRPRAAVADPSRGGGAHRRGPAPGGDLVRGVGPTSIQGRSAGPRPDGPGGSRHRGPSRSSRAGPQPAGRVLAIGQAWIGWGGCGNAPGGGVQLCGHSSIPSAVTLGWRMSHARTPPAVIFSPGPTGGQVPSICSPGGPLRFPGRALRDLGVAGSAAAGRAQPSFAHRPASEAHAQSADCSPSSSEA